VDWNKLMQGRQATGESVPQARPSGRVNRLAVTALVCACIAPVLVGGILATVFGLAALDEIEDSNGTERGEMMAKWAIGLGLVNVALSCAFFVVLALALS